MRWCARHFGFSAEKCVGLSVNRLSHTQHSIDVSRYDIINQNCFGYHITQRYESKQVKNKIHVL